MEETSQKKKIKVQQSASFKSFLDAIRNDKQSIVGCLEKEPEYIFEDHLIKVSIIYAMIKDLENLSVNGTLYTIGTKFLESSSIYECFDEFRWYSGQSFKGKKFEMTSICIMLNQIKSMKKEVESCISRVYEIINIEEGQWYSFVDEKTLYNSPFSGLNLLENMVPLLERSCSFLDSPEATKQALEETKKLLDFFLEQVSSDSIIFLITNIFMETDYYIEEMNKDLITLNNTKLVPVSLFLINKFISIRQYFLLMGFLSTYDDEHNPSLIVPALRKWLDKEYF